MGSGIRAEITVPAADVCPVAAASAETGADSGRISRSVNPISGDTVTAEFTLQIDREKPPTLPDMDVDLTEIFAYGSMPVYRFTRDRGQGCPCECIEAHDCPIVDARARGERLALVFHAPDMETLQAAIGSLRDGFPGLDVDRLLQSQGETPDENLMFVDRGSLTARQLEVLETAKRMGYFEHPKGANAGEVADELDITTSTFTEHLAAGQRKLLDAILDA